MSAKPYVRVLPALMISVLGGAACSSADDPAPETSQMKPDSQVEEKAEAKAPQSASLDQGRWTIASVGGKAAAGGSPAWLEIDLAAGRVTGNAGCNDFFASFEGTADTMKMGPVAGTKKMCPGEPMVQETAVYAILAGVSRMYVNDQGQLVLEGSSGNLVASPER